MIKKLTLLFVLVFGLVAIMAVAVPASSHAFDPIPTCSSNPDAAVCGDAKSKKNPIYGPDGILTKITNIIAIVVGVAAVIIIIISGIQYMLSTGDPAKVARAKDSIIFAVVGLVVTLMARTLVVYIIGRIR